MASETATALAAESCDHGSTYTAAGNDMEFCLACGELVRYRTDDTQEWVEIR